MNYKTFKQTKELRECKQYDIIETNGTAYIVLGSSKDEDYKLIQNYDSYKHSRDYKNLGQYCIGCGMIVNKIIKSSISE